MNVVFRLGRLDKDSFSFVLLEALGGFGLSIVCPSPRLWEALKSFDSLWEALGSFGRLWGIWEALCFGRHWEAFEGMGRF